MTVALPGIQEFVNALKSTLLVQLASISIKALPYVNAYNNNVIKILHGIQKLAVVNVSKKTALA